MDQKWSPVQVLGKYFEVYGQASQITPEAREKKAPFFTDLYTFDNTYKRSGSQCHLVAHSGVQEFFLMYWLMYL